MTDARSLIHAAGDALLTERRQLTTEELAALAAMPDESVPALAALAHEVRLAWCGPEVEVEGILSAKTGGCPEDCHFCSQSAQFDTVVQATPFLDREELIAAAAETAAIGASEFCIVLAVRGPDEKTMQRLEELVPAVREETGLNVAVSAGILTEEQAIRLAEVGTHRYNHNLETAARSSRRSSPPTRGRSASTPAGSCASTAWSSAAARCSGWGRPWPSASSCSRSSARSSPPRCR